MELFEHIVRFGMVHNKQEESKIFYQEIHQ